MFGYPSKLETRLNLSFWRKTELFNYLLKDFIEEDFL